LAEQTPIPAPQRRRPHPLFGLLAVVAAIAFVLLGRWQWQRAAEKQALASAFTAGSQAQPAPLAAASLAALPRYARIEVSGQPDGTHQFLLDNISRDGHAGYEVLTPLALADGRTVLVNRGWLPLRAGARALLPDVDLDPAAAASVQWQTRVDELPVAGLALGHQAPATDQPWPKLASFPTTAELSAALGRALEPRQLLLDSAAPAGYQRDWQPASASFGPLRHQSYAIQWWSLAALVLVLYLYMNLRRNR
jgi:surfeit locus 1 family protein